MPRTHLGDHTFWEGFARFAHTYRGQAVVTADFQRTMEEVAGESLDWFFQQWLYRPGIPYLTIESSWNSQSSALTLQVTQIQEGQVFRFPFTLAIDKNQRKTVWINYRRHTFTFHLNDQPEVVSYDPDLELLALINNTLKK